MQATFLADQCWQRWKWEFLPHLLLSHLLLHVHDLRDQDHQSRLWVKEGAEGKMMIVVLFILASHVMPHSRLALVCFTTNGRTIRICHNTDVTSATRVSSLEVTMWVI